MTASGPAAGRPAAIEGEARELLYDLVSIPFRMHRQQTRTSFDSGTSCPGLGVGHVDEPRPPILDESRPQFLFDRISVAKPSRRKWSRK